MTDIPFLPSIQPQYRSAGAAQSSLASAVRSRRTISHRRHHRAAEICAADRPQHRLNRPHSELWIWLRVARVCCARCRCFMSVACSSDRGNVGSYLRPARWRDSQGSVGLALPYCAVKAVRTDVHGESIGDCEPDEIGVLAIRGPTVFGVTMIVASVNNRSSRAVGSIPAISVVSMLTVSSGSLDGPRRLSSAAATASIQT